MFAEKFLLLLEALKNRFFDDVPPTVTSTRAAFPDPRLRCCRLQRLRVGGASLSPSSCWDPPIVPQDYTLWNDPNGALVVKLGKRAAYSFNLKT